jgi:hypothetical protein
VRKRRRLLEFFLETAVTTRRGLMRNDSASSQFLNPEITGGLPFIEAR